MKRKALTALIALAAFAFTACQEDATLEEMDQLIDDTEMTTGDRTGNGGNGSQGGTSGVG